MPVRGIRGATSVTADEPDLILEATRELLKTMIEVNTIDAADVASVMFTMTPDLTSAFPARAARRLGWTDVPLLGAVETAVPGALRRCIRVLMHVNTDRPASAIRHTYLHAATSLRPDLPK